MSIIKVYARQVPPEYQESPLQMCDEYPENTFIFGNRDFIGHCADEIATIREALENLADEFDALTDGGRGWYSTWKEALFDLMPCKESGEEYTRAERLKIAEIAREFRDTHPGAIWRETLTCAALELIHGEEFKWCTLSGCCQGDWQYCIYPASYGDGFRDTLAKEYFNTGSEWIIHEGDDAPEEPEDVDGYSMYCTSYDPRDEIADAHGVQPDEVQLYEFDGYTRRAIWKAV